MSPVHRTLVCVGKVPCTASKVKGWSQATSGGAFIVRWLLLAVTLASTINWVSAQDGPASRVRGEDGTIAGISASDDPTAITKNTVVAEPTYVIGVDDTLLVAVWKEPELTRTVVVRADGMISVPLLDDVQAAGLTPMQLAAVVKEKLKHYISDPRVTVVVTRADSQRVYVLGEVAHTGAISLLHRMTLLQALATAGLSEYANTKKIYILRTINGQQEKIPFNYKRVIKGQGAFKDILLEPRDMVVVP